jgi:ABC-type Mn2+/Zn2+ transport system ATPase subunit
VNGFLVQAMGVSARYGPRTVLHDVSVGIRPGEFWFLLGPNGSGKSTLLKVLLGALRPSSGSVDRPSPQRIGFVPQRVDLNEALPASVGELVELGLVGLRIGRAEAEARIRESLERAALPGLAPKEFNALSGGQRQRVLLARALARRPELLYLDEPTNGLDPAAEEGLLSELDRLRASGLAIVFVTHVVALAQKHASHVALFRDGRVLAGPRAEILTEARLAEVYAIRGPR